MSICWATRTPLLAVQACVSIPAALMGWLAVTFPSGLRVLGSNVWGSFLQGYGTPHVLRLLDGIIVTLLSICLAIALLIALLLYSLLAAPLVASWATFATAYSGKRSAWLRCCPQGNIPACCPMCFCTSVAFNSPGRRSSLGTWRPRYLQRT
jgi:hypothetical protein